MIRIITRTDDASMAVGAGGGVRQDYRIFDISAPEVEAFVTRGLGDYAHCVVVGVEVVANEGTPITQAQD